MTAGWYRDEPDPEVPEEELLGRPRDRKIDEAKAGLLDFFAAQPDRVFYSRQLAVLHEREFFHWITTRALGELVKEGQIGSTLMELRPGLVVRFCWAKKNRYWKRSAQKVAALIEQYADDKVGSALGNHGELMIDAALPKAGFIPSGEDVREYGGLKWEETEHDLDRVFERDGVAYGTEIKNTLDYIERDELEIKLRMCEELQLVPLFIVRFAPKSYIERVRRAGGFSLLFEYQMYPPGYEELAKRLKDELDLKVGWPSKVAAGTVQRLLNWHEGQLGA